MAWEPPAAVSALALVEVPLSVKPASAGAKRWTVTFPSNDPLSPEVQSSFSVDLDVGQYFLFVDGFNRTEQGAYTLNVKLTPL